MNIFKTILTVFVLTISGSLAANAATFTVTNTDDSGAGSLRQAITDANALAGPDTVNVTVTGTVLLVTGLPTFTDSVTVNGSGQGTFIIDGQNGAAVRPVNISGLGIQVNLRNLTVTRGVGTSLGGGVRIQGGAIVTLTNVTISANTAVGSAGLYVAESSTAYVINCRITGNTVTTAGGDGAGVQVSSSVLYMTGTTVSGNATTTSGGSTGGGISTAQSTTVGAPPPFVRIENSTISNNSAQVGGGFYNSGTGTGYLSNVTISNNTVTTTDTTNSNGGGVYNNNGTVTIRNSTIASNGANGTGAAAGQGGGIYTNSTSITTLANTIVADNTALAATSQEIRATTTAGGLVNTRGVNIIEGSSTGTLTVVNGSNITATDPQLTALANNGGPVLTQLTGASSIARNAGANTEALDTFDSPIGTEARGIGFARVVDGTVDIGAVESSVTAGLTRKALDFDGDGRSDLSVFRPADGNNFSLRSGAASTLSTTPFGLTTDRLAPADYDGDGKTDLAVFRDGTWYILPSATGQLRIVGFGSTGDLPRPGDFDGDGRADISVFRPSNGIWYRLNSSDDLFTGVQFGSNGDAPVIGDYDADGKTDYAVFRPSTGFWYVLRSSNGQVSSDAFGLTGDIPLSGDFNGDARSDLAVFRPSTGVWYVARPTGVPAQNFEASPFGLSTDTPVAADYDGDGRTDIAVFRPSNSTWYIQRSTGGVSFINFGTSTDKPTAAAYLP